MQPLRTALIADRLAGHARQAEAIVAAIGEVRPLAVTRLAARRLSPLGSHHVRASVLARNSQRLVPLVVSGDWRQPFDLVISAGGSTLTGNVLLKRRSNAANIYCGWVRGVAPDDVDCVLTYAAEHAGRPNHVFGPMPVLRFRPPHERRPLARLSGARIGIIIGGEARAAGFDFDDRYCDVLMQRLSSIAARHPDTSWVVVTSRRTPKAAYRAIETFCGSIQNCALVDYRSAGLGSISAAYSCDAVLVTDDSKSMVTEFARNGVPVGVLAVPRRGGRKLDAYSADVRAAYGLPLLEPAELEPEGLEAALTGIAIRPDDVYAETRAMIAQRLPGLFSP